MIEKYPDKPWNWEWISRNPNLSMEMIEKYPDKPWDLESIIVSNFTTDKQLFELKVKYQSESDMHPKRINMLLELRYTPEELDDIM